MSFKLWKMLFMNGRRGIMKNRGFLWRKREAKWRLVFQVRKGKNDDFAAASSHEINIIPECKMGTVGKILDRGMRPSRVFKR